MIEWYSTRGVNDLSSDSAGNLWFTDQGQSGLQDPNGRVFHLSSGGDLSMFLSNIPSPNGLILDLNERNLILAVTRANQVWRAPILDDGGTSKVVSLGTYLGSSSYVERPG